MREKTKERGRERERERERDLLSDCCTVLTKQLSLSKLEAS